MITVKGKSTEKDGFTAVHADQGANITLQGRMELSGEGGTLLYAAHKGNVNALSGENVVYSGTVAGELKGSLFHMSKGILARAGQGGGGFLSTTF